MYISQELPHIRHALFYLPLSALYKGGRKGIIGVGSVVTKDVPDNSVVVGNNVIKTYSQFIEEKHTSFAERTVSGGYSTNHILSLEV